MTFMESSECSACGDLEDDVKEFDELAGRRLCPECAAELLYGTVPMGLIEESAASQWRTVAKPDETSPFWDNGMRALEGDGGSSGGGPS